MTHRNNGETTCRDRSGRFITGNPVCPLGARHKIDVTAMALLHGEAEALTCEAVTTDAGANGPLPNARYEAFAQALARGMSALAAYREAGYRPHRSSASRLRTNESIQRRVAELMRRSADEAVVARAHVLAGLMREAGMRPGHTPTRRGAATRIAALRLLGLELGMFGKKAEHDVTDKFAEAMRTARPLPIGMTPPPLPRPR